MVGNVITLTRETLRTIAEFPFINDCCYQIKLDIMNLPKILGLKFDVDADNDDCLNMFQNEIYYYLLGENPVLELKYTSIPENVSSTKHQMFTTPIEYETKFSVDVYVDLEVVYLPKIITQYKIFRCALIKL